MLSVKSPAPEAMLFIGKLAGNRCLGRGMGSPTGEIGVATVGGTQVIIIQAMNDFKDMPIQTTRSEGHSSRENTQK